MESDDSNRFTWLMLITVTLVTVFVLGTVFNISVIALIVNAIISVVTELILMHIAYFCVEHTVPYLALVFSGILLAIESCDMAQYIIGIAVATVMTIWIVSIVKILYVFECT